MVSNIQTISDLDKISKVVYCVPGELTSVVYHQVVTCGDQLIVSEGHPAFCHVFIHWPQDHRVTQEGEGNQGVSLRELSD
jgi:hypothetical protein